MCGIAGAIGVPNAAVVAAEMLFQMQNRGQDGAGIVSSDGTTLHRVRGLGSPKRVFDGVDFGAALPGDAAIAHLRYSTSGASNEIEAVQPLKKNLRGGAVAIVHNGTLTNYCPSRQRLEDQGLTFDSDSDTELILHRMARAVSDNMADRLLESFAGLQGAYSLLCLTNDALYAVVDPHGFRPLHIARYQDGWVFSSETNALDLLGVEGKPLLPGELLKVSRGSDQPTTTPFGDHRHRSNCSFELVYFSMPNSSVFGVPVSPVRERLGKLLAQKFDRAKIPADALAIAVPDSSNIQANAFARALGIEFGFGLIRSHSVKRTFIMSGRETRRDAVRRKLGVDKALIRGRALYVIDDSVVRGSTGDEVVSLLREGGAREVHMGVASPMVKHPCFWGIDTPKSEELIAATKSVEEIAAHFKVDSLTYLTIEDLRQALEDPGGKNYCVTCFTGERPIPGELLPAEHLVRPTAY